MSMDDFDHSTRHFSVGQNVTVTKYITEPISGCEIVNAVKIRASGWFYQVQDPSGDWRWMQADQLEAAS